MLALLLTQLRTTHVDFSASHALPLHQALFNWLYIWEREASCCWHDVCVPLLEQLSFAIGPPSVGCLGCGELFALADLSVSIAACLFVYLSVSVAACLFVYLFVSVSHLVGAVRFSHTVS